jgi:hypothetical protein
MMPDIDKLIAFESGELDQDATVELFQDLVNSGLVWSLQGFYGRTANDLIDAGLVTLPQSEEDEG